MLYEQAAQTSSASRQLHSLPNPSPLLEPNLASHEHGEDRLGPTWKAREWGTWLGEEGTLDGMRSLSIHRSSIWGAFWNDDRLNSLNLITCELSLVPVSWTMPKETNLFLWDSILVWRLLVLPFVLALLLLAEGCALVAKLATHHPCGGASNLVQNLRCDGRKLKKSGQFKLGNGQFGILCLSLSKNG